MRIPRGHCKPGCLKIKHPQSHGNGRKMGCWQLWHNPISWLMGEWIMALIPVRYPFLAGVHHPKMLWWYLIKHPHYILVVVCFVSPKRIMVSSRWFTPLFLMNELNSNVPRLGPQINWSESLETWNVSKLVSFPSLHHLGVSNRCGTPNHPSH